MGNDGSDGRGCEEFLARVADRLDLLILCYGQVIQDVRELESDDQRWTKQEVTAIYAECQNQLSEIRSAIFARLGKLPLHLDNRRIN